MLALTVTLLAAVALGASTLLGVTVGIFLGIFVSLRALPLDCHACKVRTRDARDKA